MTKGVWHDLQVRVGINGSAGEAEFWLDGNRVNVLSKTEAFGTNPVGRIQLGENATGTNFDVVYDDVTVDTRFISSGSPPSIHLRSHRQCFGQYPALPNANSIADSYCFADIHASSLGFDRVQRWF